MRHRDTIAPLNESITIRPADDTDAVALERLASLDSSEVPDRPLLLAEVDGQLRVALSLTDGASIADPFQHTRSVLMLLRARARQRRLAPPSRRSGGLLRERGRLAHRRAA